MRNDLANEFYVKDINRTNGVYLNGRRISLEPLRFGDEITPFKLKPIAKITRQRETATTRFR
jgi:hypothetical protein